MPDIREIGSMTEEEYKTLLGEFFAEPKERTKMSEEEIKDLATRLNERIDVPLIRESREQKILLKVVLKVDGFLYDNLPNELYDLTRSTDQGIDDEEAERLIVRLSRLANDKIDLPYLPESAEYIAIRWIIAMVINMARKAWDKDSVTERGADIAVPESADASDADLAAMLVAA